MHNGWLVSAIALAALGACHETTAPVPPQDATALRPAAPAPVPFGPAAIDSAIRAEWAKAGVASAPRVDDARFVRRAYLDIIGTIPPPEVVTSFVADPAPDKRARLVDQLLASPAYAAYWATVWEDTLVGWQTKDQEVDRAALRTWLEAQFAANAPWDQIVTGLLTAAGRNSLGGPQDGLAPEPTPTMATPKASAPPMTTAAATTPPAVPEGTAPPSDGTPVNGAVNWVIKYRESPQDLAGNASRLFLGVQIQCAECHDHKTEKWKQDDFRRFAACFVRTRSEVLDKGKTMGRKRVDVVDIGRPLPRYAKNADIVPITQAEPTTLDGKDLGASQDLRKALAAWMTAKDNPWFAKAIVNRMWGHFLGRGFVDPIDDLRPSNPPTMPQLFDQVSDDFVAHGRDLKALIRTITATEVYQLAPAPKGTVVAASDPKTPDAAGADAAGHLWSRFHLTPLGPNELLRSLLDATGVEAIFARNARANLDRIRLQLYRRYSFLFDVDESFDQIDFEGTIAQALTLLNGPEVGGGTSAIPGGALDAILKQPGSDADKITLLYRRTIARAPSSGELAYWTHYVNEPHPVELAASVIPPAPHAPPPGPGGNGGKKKNGNANKPPPGPDAFTRLEMRDGMFPQDSRRQAYEDVFWALLNSSEFTFNH